MRPEDYIGRNIAEFHVDQPVIDEILARLTRGEVIQKYPARLRTRDGRVKHVEITSSVNFRDGDFINTRCFTVDVTDLMTAREEVRRRDDRFRKVLDALPAAVYMTDAAGRITYFNNAATALAGREPEIGKDEWCVTFRLLTPDGKPLPHDECPMAIALKENRPVRGVEAIAQRPDGSIVPFLPFPTPITDEEGNLLGAVNMLVDISDRRQAETHQRMLLDELNHRVKNNLQMLFGLLITSARESTSEEASAVLSDVSQRVAAIAAAQKLLYTAGSSRGFDALAFLNEVSATARQAFGKEVHVNITADDEILLTNQVSLPLALILNELLTNAAKHGINGRGTGEIQVTLGRESGALMLVVGDDGPGFDLLSTGRRSSGLGLVRGMCRQLGASFEVDRAAGAKCIVRFPEP